ncbi:hypothetical protein HDV06_004832 [Boothiomyces sp. JEL0866]|nr:hypothetical protein HDV06_004832 [Boothiomyces sp. JEL0866]
MIKLPLLLLISSITAQSSKIDPPTTVPATTTQAPPTTTNPPPTTQFHPTTTDKPPPITSNAPPNTNTNGQVTQTGNSASSSPTGNSDNNSNNNGTTTGGQGSPGSGNGMSTGLIIGLAVGLGLVFIGIILLACWKSNLKSPLKTITPIKRAEPSPTIKPFDHEARPLPYYNRQASPIQNPQASPIQNPQAINQERRPSQPDRPTARPVYNQQYATYETYEDSPYNEYYDQEYYEYDGYQPNDQQLDSKEQYDQNPAEQPETIERGEIPIMKSKNDSSVEDIQPPLMNRQKQAQDTLHSIDKRTLQPPLMSPK